MNFFESFTQQLGPQFIIGQIIGMVAFFISCAKNFKKKRSDIMKLSLASYICYIVHYFLIDAIAGAYTLFIALLRDYYIYLREKHHKKHRNRNLYNNPFIFISFSALYITLIAANLNNPVNILPLAAGFTYLFFEWFSTNKTTLKFAAALTTLPWIVFNVFSLSISGIITDSISVVAAILGILKDKKLRKKVVRHHH